MNSVINSIPCPNAPLKKQFGNSTPNFEESEFFEIEISNWIIYNSDNCTNDNQDYYNSRKLIWETQLSNVRNSLFGTQLKF